jgi:hypothetical protein
MASFYSDDVWNQSFNWRFIVLSVTQSCVADVHGVSHSDHSSEKRLPNSQTS